MAFSYEDLVASSGQQNFAFNIPYLSQNDVSVFQNGVVLTPITDWTFLMAQVVRLTVGAVLDDVIRVRRVTPIDEPIVDYANGSVLGENELDATALQSLFAAQEVADDASNTIHADASLRWDALGRRIINVGTPTTNGDAVNKEFADGIVDDAEAAAAAASASASAASTSATDAAASAAKLSGTSTTSLLIAVASKVFTTQTGKSFAAGAWLLITSDADPTNYMHGQVTSYVTTTLTVNVTNIGGAGTFADWTIRVSGTRGGVGAQGPQGDPGVDGDAAVVAHIAAADDHTQYQKENEKDIANGYAGIDGSGELSRADVVGTASINDGAVTGAKIFAAGGNGMLLGTAEGTSTPAVYITLGTNLSMAGSTLNGGSAALPPGYIQGLTYANNGTDSTNDLDIAAGQCRDATNAHDISVSALTKQSDATFVVGTNQGMLDTGVVGNSDYYLWAIKRSDTGVTDILSSLSSTSPSMPAAYDFKRLIGWFRRAGGSISLVKTYETEGGGLELLWDFPTLDIDLSNTLGTARRTDAIKVPLNFSVMASINVRIANAEGTAIYYLCCPDVADLAPSTTVRPLSTYYAQTAAAAMIHHPAIRTSATGTIAIRAGIASVDEYKVVTLGFTWSRRTL